MLLVWQADCVFCSNREFYGLVEFSSGVKTASIFVILYKCNELQIAPSTWKRSKTFSARSIWTQISFYIRHRKCHLFLHFPWNSPFSPNRMMELIHKCLIWVSLKVEGGYNTYTPGDKAKVRSSPCARHKGIWRSRGIAPLIGVDPPRNYEWSYSQILWQRSSKNFIVTQPRTESGLKEPTTDFGILYVWGPPTPRDLRGLYLRHCSRSFSLQHWKGVVNLTPWPESVWTLWRMFRSRISAFMLSRFSVVCQGKMTRVDIRWAVRTLTH
jgi:hypothetical protein